MKKTILDLLHSLGVEDDMIMFDDLWQLLPITPSAIRGNDMQLDALIVARQIRTLRVYYYIVSANPFLALRHHPKLCPLKIGEKS